jgi:hypothetical protein
MSTWAFIPGASGTELTSNERVLVSAGWLWDFIPFSPSVQISTQVALQFRELASLRPVAADRIDLSIPVDGAGAPVHPVTTSATMVAQVIRNAAGFQGLLMSDDASQFGPRIARANTAAA